MVATKQLLSMHTQRFEETHPQKKKKDNLDGSGEDDADSQSNRSIDAVENNPESTSLVVSKASTSQKRRAFIS